MFVKRIINSMIIDKLSKYSEVKNTAEKLTGGYKDFFYYHDTETDKFL